MIDGFLHCYTVGWLYDATCSYSYSFYFGGGAFALAFFVLSFIPYLLRKYPHAYNSKRKIDKDKTFSISFLGTMLKESSV